MADETGGISNKEKLVICTRCVDYCFVIHKDFIEMYPLGRTNADPVGSAMMEQQAGEKTGVATQIKAINGKC